VPPKLRTYTGKISCFLQTFNLNKLNNVEVKENYQGDGQDM